MARGDKARDSTINTPGTTGKQLDAAELRREDGSYVQRQRAVLGSDELARLQVMVGGEPGRGYLLVDGRMLNELERMNDKLDQIAFLLEGLAR